MFTHIEKKSSNLLCYIDVVELYKLILMKAFVAQTG